MFAVLAAIGREIEFFKDCLDMATSPTQSEFATIALRMYNDLSVTLEYSNNDIARIHTIKDIMAASPSSQCKALLADFIKVHDPVYKLDYADAEAAICAILAQSGATTEAEVGDTLFNMSMTCKPEYIKEIVAKLA